MKLTVCLAKKVNVFTLYSVEAPNQKLALKRIEAFIEHHNHNPTFTNGLNWSVVPPGKPYTAWVHGKETPTLKDFQQRYEDCHEIGIAGFPKRKGEDVVRKITTHGVKTHERTLKRIGAGGKTVLRKVKVSGHKRGKQ